MDARGRRTSGAAWREVCERLAAMGEEILGDDLARRRAGSRRGHAPPRHAGRVLVHVRHRLQRSRTTRRSSAAPTPRTRGVDPTSTRWRAAPPSTAPARTACRDAWARARSSCSRSRAARCRAAAPRSPPRCRRRRSGSRPGDTFEILRRRRGAVRAPGCRSAPGPGFVHVRDYYFDWVAGRAGDVRDRAARHRRARRRPTVSAARVAADARDRGARGRALERLLPRPAGAHARRADTATSSACPTSPGAACRTSSTATASCRSPTTRRSWSSSIRRAAALWGVSSLHAGVVRAARLRDPRDQPQPPPGHRRRRRARAGRARRRPTPAPPTGSTPRAAPTCSPPCAGSGRRSRRRSAARSCRSPTLDDAPARRPSDASTPTRAPTSSAAAPRTCRGGTARERVRQLGRRARRHRDRRVEGRRTRHRAAPRAAGRVAW